MSKIVDTFNSCVSASASSTNHSFANIAKLILESGKYTKIGKHHMRNHIAALTQQDPTWAHLQSALDSLEGQQKAAKKAAKAAAPQVVPQAQAPSVSIPSVTIPQVVPQQVVTPQSVAVAVAPSQTAAAPQPQNAPRPILHGTVVGTYGDLRLVQTERKDKSVTYWVADNYGKSVASLGRLEKIKQACAILDQLPKS